MGDKKDAERYRLVRSGRVYIEQPGEGDDYLMYVAFGDFVGRYCKTEEEFDVFIDASINIYNGINAL